jgi:hypothetical protein
MTPLVTTDGAAGGYLTPAEFVQRRFWPAPRVCEVTVSGKVPRVSGKAKGKLRRLPPPDWLLLVDEDLWMIDWAMAMNWKDDEEE